MDDPYLNTLIYAIVTVAFILVGSLAVGALARGVVRLRGGSNRLQQNTFAGYAFVSPWLIGFFLFVLAPMLASLYWSFTQFKPPDPPQWVALQNYARVLADKDFQASLVNTLFLTVIGLPLQILAALGLALLLNARLRGEKMYRMAFYLPVILGLNSAVLLSWRLMLNANNGLVNTIIRGLGHLFAPFNWADRILIYINEVVSAFFLGIQSGGNFTLMNKIVAAGMPAAERVPLWLQSPLWTKTSIVLLMMWSCGTMMLIFLAALNNVPSEIYEAADVDGANSWQRFRNVTLPLISPAMFYNLVVGTIATIQIFEQTYVLFRDTPTVGQSAYSVVYYLWRATFRFNQMGYGSAISWILLLLLVFVTVIQFRLQGRWVQYDLK
jgi:ABC-type sugar transport system permease subunit